MDSRIPTATCRGRPRGKCGTNDRVDWPIKGTGPLRWVFLVVLADRCVNRRLSAVRAPAIAVEVVTSGAAVGYGRTSPRRSLAIHGTASMLPGIAPTAGRPNPEGSRSGWAGGLTYRPSGHEIGRAMNGKQELLEIERARWGEFRDLVDRIPSDRMEDPTLNDDGWSVKDLLWHVRCWNTVVADELQRIQAGTFKDFEWNTEQNNERFLAEGRRMDALNV